MLTDQFLGRLNRSILIPSPDITPARLRKEQWNFLNGAGER